MHRHLRTHEKGGELPPPDYVVKHDYAKPRKRTPSRRLIENMETEGASPQQEGQCLKKKVGSGDKKAGSGDKKAGEKKMSPHKSPVIEVVVENKAVEDTDTSEQPMDLTAAEVYVPKEIDHGGEKREEELSCPICNKTFLCQYGLQTHIDQHPNKVLECMICSATFRNQKGLRMHVHMAHRKNKPSWPKPTPCMTPEEQEALSMAELSFLEFSSPKFPLIAQVWCEKNSPKLNSSDNSYTCSECNKSFPCQGALDLHEEKSHTNLEKPDLDDSSCQVVSLVAKEDTVSRDEFLAALNLKPKPIPKSPLKAPSIDSGTSSPTAPILNSMLNKPSLTSPERAKTSLLQQHLEGSPLLAMKHFSNPLGAKPHATHTKPMKHSPVKGTTPGNVPAVSKSDMDPNEAHEPGLESDLEPRSGDVAREMHTPGEIASQSHSAVDVSRDHPEELTGAESDSGVAMALEEIDEEPCDLSSPSKKKGTHVCKYCKKVFPFSSTLKVHTRSHMGLMPYKCMLCDYASADKSTLVRHMRTHSGERPYACKVCDFAFTTKANCERHVRKRHHKNTKEEAEEVIIHNPTPKHDNENKYSSPCTVCKICDRDFKFFRDLQNHLRVHEKTPQKPFTCTKCQVGFSSLSNCARHILRRHEEVKSDEVESFITVFQHEEEKSAPVLKVPVYIKEEKRSETPVLDDQGEQIEPLDFSVKRNCESDAPSGSTKQRRTSIFTEDSPIDLSMPKSNAAQNFTVKTATAIGKYRFKEVYHKFYSQTIDALVCPHCTMTFHRGSLLKAHVRSHTNERPYRCIVCSAAFTMQANLVAHIARRHSDSQEPEAQQSFIQRSATPMQFRLMAKSASSHRFTSRASKTAIPLVSPNTPVGAAQQIKLGPSPHNSIGSDSSGELASVSKMLAATDSNHFKLFLSPPETRSPITVSEIFRQNDDDEESQDIMSNINGEPPEMKETSENEHLSVDGVGENLMSVDGVLDARISVKREFVEQDDLVADDDQEGELQIVEDVKAEQSEKEVKQEVDDKKRRGTKFESKQSCPYCGRRFPWISSLRRHILTHTGLKPYQCPQCGANFSTKSNCERHIVRRHGGARPGSLGGTVPGGQDQPFMCPECKGFKCTTRTQLQLHYEQSHPQINFAGIYPEAKKVASTSVDIMNKQLDVKLSSDAPLCLSMNSNENSKTQEIAEDIPKDLSTSRVSEKKSRPTDQPLMVKLFMKNGRLTTTMEVIKGPYPSSKAVVAAVSNSSSPSQRPETVDTSDKDRESVQGKEDDIERANGVEEATVGDGSEGMGDDQQDSDAEREARTGSPSALSQTVQSDGTPGMTVNAKPPSRGKKNRAKFECTQCCKRFKTALTLEKHEKVHEVEHPFHCSDCKATFTTKFNCHRHMMKLHKKSREEVASWGLREDGSSSVKNGLVNGEEAAVSTGGDQEVENMSNASLKLGDSVSAIGDSNRGSRTATPVSHHLGQKSRKRPALTSHLKKTKSPKLDEALMSGAVLDFQGSNDKLMAVENWLNSDLELQNGQVNDYGPEGEMSDYDSEIPILNPDSPTISNANVSRHSVIDVARKKPAQQQGLYMASFLEDEDSLVAQDVANPTDVFTGGQAEEKNDIISNLLGIQDSSVVDQMLESADSAARLLGVSDG